MTDTSRRRILDIDVVGEGATVVVFLADARFGDVNGTAFSGEAFVHPDTTNTEATIIAVVKKNNFPFPTFDQCKTHVVLNTDIDCIVQNYHSPANPSRDK